MLPECMVSYSLRQLLSHFLNVFMRFCLLVDLDVNLYHIQSYCFEVNHVVQSYITFSCISLNIHREHFFQIEV